MTTSKQVRDIVNRVTGGNGYRDIEFTIPLAPLPCPRPRLTRYGKAYMPARYRAWTDAAMPAVPEVYPLLQGPLSAGILQIIAPPKTVTRTYPRFDIDNYMKSVLDLVTKSERIYEDDEQVVLVCSWKRFTKPGEEPHTYVYIREN